MLSPEEHSRKFCCQLIGMVFNGTLMTEQKLELRPSMHGRMLYVAAESRVHLLREQKLAGL